MPLDATACGAFILLAFTLAGVAQTAWFASPLSRAFAVPLDGGLRFRQRRLFGANKTIRGFVVMVPAAAASFALLAAITPASAGLWNLSTGWFAVLGAAAGFGFMAGELPNSFVKRQLNILPGAAPFERVSSAIQFVADRLDSGLGMLLAMTVLVPMPWQTWAVVLIIGPAIHWVFSVVMFHLGLKARPA